MIDIKKINWDELKNPPGEYFTLFKPDEKDPIQFYIKLERFKKYLKEKYLYMSDELRTDNAIQAIVAGYFSGLSLNVFYEMGKFQGLIGFINILPEYKASLLFKIWDKSLWKKSFVRATIDLIDLYMKEFKLKRINTRTADPKVVKMARMAGFKIHGKLPLEFKWKNKFYTEYILGKTEE